MRGLGTADTSVVSEDPEIPQFRLPPARSDRPVASITPSRCARRRVVRLRGHQHPEMQLGQRRDTDRGLHAGRGTGANQHRRIEENAAHAEGIDERTGKALEVLVPAGSRWGHRRVEHPLQRVATDPGAPCGGSEFRRRVGRQPVIVNRSPAFARPQRPPPTLLPSSFCGIVVTRPRWQHSPQDLTDTVAQPFLRDRGHEAKVAALLPTTRLLGCAISGSPAAAQSARGGVRAARVPGVRSEPVCALGAGLFVIARGLPARGPPRPPRARPTSRRSRPARRHGRGTGTGGVQAVLLRSLLAGRNGSRADRHRRH